MQSRAQQIRDHALTLGLNAVGIAPAAEARHGAGLRRWLDAGYHGEMRWLANRLERRLDPREVVPNARSVIMVAVQYFTEEPPAHLWQDPMRGRVARYAWGPDYHDRLLPALMKLANWLRTSLAPHAATRAYVDTGPLLERTWSAEAGLGFIGRNTLLIRPSAGSYLFLGGIITDLELDYDTPATDDGATLGNSNCGQCQRCLNACPTQAFPAPYTLDSNRCISYLTIELKTAIPEPLRPLMENWIFGCDACQQVCPWVRRYSTPADQPFLAFDAARFAPDLIELMTMDNATFRARYKGTPLLRTKRRGLLRNAAVALGNARNPDALPVLRKACADPEPLIRTHAEWAIRHIQEQT